jgi:secreted PhoX family phosphatase
VAASSPFNGGEGVEYSLGIIYFTTKGDNRVWEYDPHNQLLSVLYDASQDPGRQLTGVDNLASSSGGDLLVAEDGGNMELVIITPEGTASALLRIAGQSSSEITGPAFNPAGTRLYFSSQRAGTNGRGITYEVSGPFRG